MNMKYNSIENQVGPKYNNDQYTGSLENFNVKSISLFMNFVQKISKW